MHNIYEFGIRLIYNCHEFEHEIVDQFGIHIQCVKDNVKNKIFVDKTINYFQFLINYQNMHNETKLKLDSNLNMYIYKLQRPNSIKYNKNLSLKHKLEPCFKV